MISTEHWPSPFEQRRQEELQEEQEMRRIHDRALEEREIEELQWEEEHQRLIAAQPLADPGIVPAEVE